MYKNLVVTSRKYETVNLENVTQIIKEGYKPKKDIKDATVDFNETDE